MAYLDIANLKLFSSMPDEDIDLLPEEFVLQRLHVRSSEIDARLRKRYKVPFEHPVPDVVRGWLADLVTVDMYQRRGVNPADDTFQAARDAAAQAREQMRESADAREGLYDLPLRHDLAESGIASAGGPLGYSEASPYDWADRQRENLRGR
jgi:hypothetical protein